MPILIIPLLSATTFPMNSSYAVYDDNTPTPFTRSGWCLLPIAALVPVVVSPLCLLLFPVEREVGRTLATMCAAVADLALVAMILMRARSTPVKIAGTLLVLGGGAFSFFAVALLMMAK